jgi:hypothetical protein
MTATQAQLATYVRSLTGIREKPPTSNHVIWIDGTNLWVSLGFPHLDGTRAGAWCGAAGYKIDLECGRTPPYSVNVAISCIRLRDWATKNRIWTQTPSVGDKVILGGGTHQGTVIDVRHWASGKGHVVTGEGNWSDAFRVEKRSRHGSERIDGFVARGYSGSGPAPTHTAPEQKWSRIVTLRDGRKIATHVDYWVTVGFQQRYAVAVMAIQYWLTRAGFATAVDGEFGPHTRAQVKAFQRARGLTVNGTVNAPTAVKLGITTP